MYNLLPLNAGTNTFGSANLLLNWWELLWEHHHIEIIWAAVFAVIFGFLWEWFLHPYIKKVEIFIKLKKIIEKFWKRGNTTFHEVEIANSIKSNYPKEVPEHFIVDAIQKHNALTTNSRFHYQSFDKSYHACRFLTILPIIDGDELFFREICKAMAMDCNSVEVDMFLSIKKPTNKIFPYEFVSHWPRCIPSHSISCHEKKLPFWKGGDYLVEFEYEEGKSLEGVKVILLESFLLFPPTVQQAIKWLREQGAIVQKVVIFFDGMRDPACFDSYGIRQTDIMVGCSVNMKVTKLGDCHCKNKNKVRLLKYQKY
ncbi:MAG: hypothetical protein ABH886_03695 [Candidatus Desantisbacteria bacterium]